MMSMMFPSESVARSLRLDEMDADEKSWRQTLLDRKVRPFPDYYNKHWYKDSPVEWEPDLRF